MGEYLGYRPPWNACPHPYWHLVVATKTCTVVKQAIHILLECFIFTALKRSLGQGNMFTGVCLSTGGVPGPWEGGLVPGVLVEISPRRLLLRAVHILLECILVVSNFVTSCVHIVAPLTKRWNVHLPLADPEFPRRGRQPLSLGQNLTFDKILLKTGWKGKKLDQGVMLIYILPISRELPWNLHSPPPVPKIWNPRFLNLLFERREFWSTFLMMKTFQWRIRSFAKLKGRNMKFLMPLSVAFYIFAWIK